MRPRRRHCRRRPRSARRFRCLGPLDGGLSVEWSPPARLIENHLHALAGTQLIAVPRCRTVRPVPPRWRAPCTSRSAELNATPATPCALFVFAEIVPTRAIRDRCRRCRRRCGSAAGVVRGAQPTALPARSGCVWSMPVSTIAHLHATARRERCSPSQVPSPRERVDVGVRGAARLPPCVSAPYSLVYRCRSDVASVWSTKFAPRRPDGAAGREERARGSRGYRDETDTTWVERPPIAPRSLSDAGDSSATARF